jgi:hypothetical protein
LPNRPSSVSIKCLFTYRKRIDYYILPTARTFFQHCIFQTILNFAETQLTKWKLFYPKMTSSVINEFILSGIDEDDAIAFRDFVDHDESNFLEFCKLQDDSKEANLIIDSDESDIVVETNIPSHLPSIDPNQHFPVHPNHIISLILID